MEQERKKQPARNSRGAQAAQRRREIRKENARLSRLREKQKRKAKKRSGKRIDKGIYKRLTIMVGVVLAVVLSMVIFFRVQHIEVEGVRYYTEEEILAVAGVAEGDNLLTLSRSEISGNIMAAREYIDSVKVTRKLPNTLILTVTELDPNYAVQDVLGDYYLITAQGETIKNITARQAANYILVQELVIETPTVGEEVQIHGDSALARGQLSAMKMLLQELENAELVKEISSVSVPSSYKISLRYGERFAVELGNTDRLDYKLAYLKAVIAEEKSYTTGTIDLTLNSGDQAHILRDE